MDYQQIKMKVQEVLERGGFSRDEPLDSIELISSSKAGPISPVQIGAFSSVLSFAGEWDRAEAVARSIPEDPGERGLALSELAQRLAAADLLERAEAVVRSIPNSDDRSGYMVEKVTALLAIASKFLTQSNYEHARAVLDEAEIAIEHLQHPDHLLVSLLGDLANLLTKNGQVDRANIFWDKAIDTAQASIQSYRAGRAPDVDTWKALEIIADDLFPVDVVRAERAIALIDNEAWRERARRAHTRENRTALRHTKH